VWYCKVNQDGGGEAQVMSPEWEKIWKEALSWKLVWKSVLCEHLLATGSCMKTVSMRVLSDGKLVIKFQKQSCVAGTLIITYICWDTDTCRLMGQY